MLTAVTTNACVHCILSTLSWVRVPAFRTDLPLSYALFRFILTALMGRAIAQHRKTLSTPNCPGENALLQNNDSCVRGQTAIT